MNIKPIETIYNGYRFRSRLEARWAVFFDTAGIPYEYEPQGFLVGSYGDDSRKKYLPDFYLPKTKTWVEVKGDIKCADFQLLADSVDWGCGLPETKDSLGGTSGLLLLGEIPNIETKERVCHVILQHSKGGWVALTCFTDSGVHDSCTEFIVYFDSSCGPHKRGDDWVEYVISSIDGCLLFKDSIAQQKISDAYIKARQSRFEYGEKGGL